MILLALLGLARADTASLRAPGLGAAWTVEASPKALEVGGWLGPKLGVAVAVYPSGWFPEVAVGTTRMLAGGEIWRVDGILSGGLAVPLLGPAAVITASPAVQAGRHGERVLLTGTVVAPLAVEVAPDLVARLPLSAELQLAVRLGPVWVGGRAALGRSWVPGHLATTDVDAGLSVGWVPTVR